jgi:carbonic anhydrase
MSTMTPAEAWAALRAGNQRFVDDAATHPSQGVDRRRELQAAQHPHTVILGCSDSRVSPEIVFDQGLGDVFVVRTAGHVVEPAVLGSIEYGVGVLGARLVVVLGHGSCGAVAATAHTLATGEQPPGFVRAVVDRVIPSVSGITSRDDGALRSGAIDADVLRTEHVRRTVELIQGSSAALGGAVGEGRAAIVGAEYDFADGSVRLVEVAGDVGEHPES